MKPGHEKEQANSTARKLRIGFGFSQFADKIPRQDTTAGITSNLFKL
jgi:hypothetical protein